MLLEADDFQTLTDAALRSFDERMAEAPAETARLFDVEVARLESNVIQLYGIAALSAKRELDLDKVAAIWDSMVTVCDAVAERLRKLCDAHPLCEASHDKILDIRNKAARLRELHQ